MESSSKVSKMEEEVAIGIDLGTTNTCIAVMKKHDTHPQVEIIANSMGNRVTPSYVAFTESEQFVGLSAKDQATSNPLNTIYEAKRLIGRKLGDPEVQEKIKTWPFTVTKDAASGNTVYEVQYMKNKKCVTPEQISAMVLTDVKKTAEEFLDCKVTKAVITVPAYFTDSQRQATIDAGVIAGLEVMEIINEPTAAAIAYGFNKKFEKEKNVFVFDFGGGTLDVAIIGITNHDFNVKAVSGDNNLGGGDIDNMLMEYLVNELKEANEVDLMKDPRALGRLRKQCESAKCFLSNKGRHEIRVDSLYNGKDFSKLLSRVKFDDICSDLFDRIIPPVETALSESGLSVADIDDVILVGGTTRIPCIQERLEEFFEGKELKKTVNPEEAVAHGAAIRAATLSDVNAVDEVKLMDVIPLSLGINVRKTDMSVIIRRNTKIPVSKSVEFTTPVDNQTSVKIEILEGDKSKSAENNLLGEFVLQNIQMAPKGVPRIKINLNVDRNGILTVTAEDVVAGSRNDLTIDTLKGRLSQAEIAEMSAQSRLLKRNNEKVAENSKARENLESFATKMKKGVTKKKNKKLISEDSYVKVNSACLEVLEWIEDNPNSTAMECKKKFDELKEFCGRHLSNE